jgi:hypothetical protein
MYTHYALGN